jgi:hypothetical protein
MTARTGRAAGAVLACLLMGTGAVAAPVKVDVSASKTEVTVGEPFIVKLQAEGPPGTTWAFPEKAGDDHVSLRSLPPAKGAEAPGEHRYEAMAFVLDQVTLPAIEVGYRLPDGTRGKVASEALKVKVGSLLTKDAQGSELVDVRPPVRVLPGAPFWIAVAALAGVLAAVITWLVRRRRRPAASLAEVVSVVPPAVEARAALDALTVDSLEGDEEFRLFYIRLTEIAKRYLERRLGGPVVEMTSAEVAAYLREHPYATGVLSPMRELARTADHVKFARGSSRREEARRQLLTVRAVVDEVEARAGAAEQAAEARSA